MSRMPKTHEIARGRTRQRWLALVFIVTVLFCHGWLGAAHVAGESPVQSGADHRQNSHAVHDDATAHGSHVVHESFVHESVPHEYFAAFFTALLGSLLLLFRPAATKWVGLVAALYEKKVSDPSGVPPTARPTPQLLQVFRL